MYYKSLFLFCSLSTKMISMHCSRKSLFEDAAELFDKKTGVLEAPMIITVADQVRNHRIQSITSLKALKCYYISHGDESFFSI